MNESVFAEPCGAIALHPLVDGGAGHVQLPGHRRPGSDFASLQWQRPVGEGLVVRGCERLRVPYSSRRPHVNGACLLSKTLGSP